MKNKRYLEERDGVEMWTEGEVFTAPGGEIVEVLYETESSTEKKYFVELSGTPACAHGDTVLEAIDDAMDKRGEREPLSEDEKKEYRADNYKFSARLFMKLTRACKSGTRAWLKERGLPADVTMTIAEFRKAGGRQWADALEESIK